MARHPVGQRTAKRAGRQGLAGRVASPVHGHAAAGGDRCEAAGQVPLPVDWLRLARIARILSWLTLAWLGIEGGAAIIAAVMAGSVALLGFGLDSGIEAMASAIVIWRFTGTRLASAASERRAQRLVVVSSFLLAPYIAVEATGALVAGDRAETSIAGLNLTAGTAPADRLPCRTVGSQGTCFRALGSPWPARLQLPVSRATQASRHLTTRHPVRCAVNGRPGNVGEALIGGTAHLA